MTEVFDANVFSSAETIHGKGESRSLGPMTLQTLSFMLFFSKIVSASTA